MKLLDCIFVTQHAPIVNTYTAFVCDRSSSVIFKKTVGIDDDSYKECLCCRRAE